MGWSSGACVLGDYDLVAPLVLAGVRCTVVAPPHDPVRHSRHSSYLGWAEARDDPDELLSLLRSHAEGLPEPPVLYFQSDAATLLVSRHRRQLADLYRFAVADEVVVEDLIDKERFRLLADRADLPVPPSGLLDPLTGPVIQPPLEFPVIVKPASRGESLWDDLMQGKALHVQDQAELEALWPSLAAVGAPLLAQQLVVGPESSIESYHCYVSGDGEVVAEFTGRKIRTFPARFGHSTAVSITDVDDVRRLGRRVVESVGLTGVAKCDFKRGPDGRLWLLEINPRFNLWHYPGAIAGVNLPALVHADLTGDPRPATSPVAAGVSWMCSTDLRAARDSGVSLRTWAAFAWRCQARRNLAWDDPAPLLRTTAERIRRSLTSAFSSPATAPKEAACD